MICVLTGSDLGVPQIPECWLLEWREGACRVVFSFARQGNGITAHFAANRDSLRRVKEAIDDFVTWLFWAYDWCEMVFAIIGIPSVERLVMKCGFSFLTDMKGYRVYMRARK